MGIKKSKIFLNKGGFYLNFFQNLKNILIKGGILLSKRMYSKGTVNTYEKWIGEFF